jgi:hypothetical protein
MMGQMGQMGQNIYTGAQNNVNYQQRPNNLRGPAGQPSYPVFKEKEPEVKKEDVVSQNLAKELESEIKELQQLNKEAKELAEKVMPVI